MVQNSTELLVKAGKDYRDAEARRQQPSLMEKAALSAAAKVLGIAAVLLVSSNNNTLYAGEADAVAMAGVGGAALLRHDRKHRAAKDTVQAIEDAVTVIEADPLNTPKPIWLQQVEAGLPPDLVTAQPPVILELSAHH